MDTPGAFANMACPCSSANCLTNSDPSSSSSTSAEPADATPLDATIDYSKYSHLSAFTVPQLIQHILSYQGARDKTYKDLGTAFEGCLIREGGRLQGFKQADYIATITDTAANFAVLSKFVRICLHYLELLETTQTKPFVAATKLLQSSEKQKLELTAAYHLAHVRSITSLNDAPSPGASVGSLLDGEMESLRGKLKDVDDTIGECRDELREGLL
jgi:hypothetical protein